MAPFFYDLRPRHRKQPRPEQHIIRLTALGEGTAKPPLLLITPFLPAILPISCQIKGAYGDNKAIFPFSQGWLFSLWPAWHG